VKANIHTFLFFWSHSDEVQTNLSSSSSSSSSSEEDDDDYYGYMGGLLG
jgi:hypothetical protein